MEKVGIPTIAEEREGYSIMKNYRLPPVMLIENKAFVLITAEQLILNDKFEKEKQLSFRWQICPTRDPILDVNKASLVTLKFEQLSEPKRSST